MQERPRWRVASAIDTPQAKAHGHVKTQLGATGASTGQAKLVEQPIIRVHVHTACALWCWRKRGVRVRMASGASKAAGKDAQAQGQCVRVHVDRSGEWSWRVHARASHAGTPTAARGHRQAQGASKRHGREDGRAASGLARPRGQAAQSTRTLGCVARSSGRRALGGRSL